MTIVLRSESNSVIILTGIYIYWQLVGEVFLRFCSLDPLEYNLTLTLEARFITD